MSLSEDLKILYHLAFKPVKGVDHQERLESFYSGQAKGYDNFRERLLKGRSELIFELEKILKSQMSMQDQKLASWIDLGGGTGRNLDYSQSFRESFESVKVVDLAQSLLDRTAERIKLQDWNNVSCVNADATLYSAENADLVTFSYSITMIPDWYRAIDNAAKMLKPGGLIGVVDFYVSRKYGFRCQMAGDLNDNSAKEVLTNRHSWFTRTFWPTWFGFDNVMLSSDHVPYLTSKFEVVSIKECYSSVPYLPFIEVPYYIFIGRLPKKFP